MSEHSDPPPATSRPLASYSIEARVTDHAVRLAFLALFVYWSLTLILPFARIAVWSVILSVALYPVYRRLTGWLGGRKFLAALLTTAAVVLVVLGPVALLVSSLAGTVVDFANQLDSGALHLPAPPDSLDDLPLIGHRLHEFWLLASQNLVQTLEKFLPYLQALGAALLFGVAALGKDVLMLIVAVVIAGCLFAPGPRLAAEGRRFANRLVVPRGEHFVDLAGATIRNVSRGVIGLAFVQAVLAGTVLLIDGVPGAGLAAFGILIFCILQLGPLLILVPITIWAWWSMPVGAALVTTLLLIPVAVLDNVVKPVLIARGLNTSPLVILVGVIGGTLSYGLVGLFLGPVVLAVFAELLSAWVKSGRV